MSTQISFKLSMGTEEISPLKLIIFFVSTHTQNSLSASKSTISWPPLANPNCLRINHRYQKWLSVNGPVIAEFDFIAIAIWGTGALLKKVSLKKLILPGKKKEGLSLIFQIVELHETIRNLVYSSLMIIILDENTSSVKRTNNNFKTDIRTVANNQTNSSGSSY